MPCMYVWIVSCVIKALCGCDKGLWYGFGLKCAYNIHFTSVMYAVLVDRLINYSTLCMSLNSFGHEAFHVLYACRLTSRIFCIVFLRIWSFFSQIYEMMSQYVLSCLVNLNITAPSYLICFLLSHSDDILLCLVYKISLHVFWILPCLSKWDWLMLCLY